jgi:hypothetical protein
MRACVCVCVCMRLCACSPRVRARACLLACVRAWRACVCVRAGKDYREGRLEDRGRGVYRYEGKEKKDEITRVNNGGTEKGLGAEDETEGKTRRLIESG